MVAIKDMEMPRSCYTCREQTNCYWALSNGWLEDKRDDNCPLVEIGTCKDCKYLLKDISSFCCRINYRRVTNQNFYCGNYEKREGEVVEMTREIWEERKNPPIDGKTDF